MMMMMMMMMILWIAAMLFNKIDSAQLYDVNQPNRLITTDVGDNVTLHCFRLREETAGAIVWYKQKLGHELRVMVTVQQELNYEDDFKSPRFSIRKEKGSCHLKIAYVEPSDEAMYYCGFRKFLTTFAKGTFLSVKGKPGLRVSVLQNTVLDSVPAGASVTLQCSVLSESRAAELQVLWFRAAPPQSHPQIIYTHHNSSHQCESGSSTHTCVYNFSKNILSLSDTGTYYCAVAACGKIIFGNGTRVRLATEKSLDPVVMICALLSVLIVSCTFYIIYNCFSGRAEDPVGKKTPNQIPGVLGLNFAALHINNRKGKRDHAHDNVYSEVIYSPLS